METNWDRVNQEIAANQFKGETGKARGHRLLEGWFERYCPANQPGIDIGCADDPIHESFRRWDIVLGDGDATYLEGVDSCSFRTVYASHVLEHLIDPVKALARWYEVVVHGGHLIVLVPHRDLYEKKRFLPSRWNPDHKYFWHPDVEEPPCTKCLRLEMLKAVPKAEIVSYDVLKAGYDHSLATHEHPVGEYSIEMIVRRLCA